MSPYDLSGGAEERVLNAGRTPFTPLHSTPLGGTPLTPPFPSPDFGDLEDAIKAFVKPELTDFVHHVWIAPLGPVLAVADGLVRIAAASHLRGWVRERYGELLSLAASTALGQTVQVALVRPDWTLELQRRDDLRREAAEARELQLLERRVNRKPRARS